MVPALIPDLCQINLPSVSAPLPHVLISKWKHFFASVSCILWCGGAGGLRSCLPGEDAAGEAQALPESLQNRVTPHVFLLILYFFFSFPPSTTSLAFLSSILQNILLLLSLFLPPHDPFVCVQKCTSVFAFQNLMECFQVRQTYGVHSECLPVLQLQISCWRNSFLIFMCE